MNITLIGMPSSGKSTIGVVLAKLERMDFIDVDLLIQHQSGKRLKEIIAEKGNEGFHEVESRAVCSLTPQNSIISPGGSVCYEPEAMEHLKEISTVVYLSISYEEMASRIGNPTDRGVTIPDGYTLRDLYNERLPLYERFADYTFDETGLDAGTLVQKIRTALFRN